MTQKRPLLAQGSVSSPTRLCTRFRCGLRTQKGPVPPSLCGSRGHSEESWCCCLGCRTPTPVSLSPGPHSNTQDGASYHYLCRGAGKTGLPVESFAGSSVPLPSGRPSGGCRGPSPLAWL